MKRKIRLKTTKSLVLFSSLAMIIPTTFFALKTTQIALQVQLHNDPSEDDIPKEFLDITGGTLWGFSYGHTIQEVRKKGYKNLVIPEGVKKIGNYAFANMFDGSDPATVRSLVLNRDLEEIGTGAFLNCWGFENDLNLQDTKVRYIGAEAFFNCSGFGVSDSATGELRFPKELKEIGDSAFRYCSSLKKVIMPPSIEKVGAYAFNSCQDIVLYDFSYLESIPSWMYKSNQLIFYASYSGVGEINVNLVNNTAKEWEEVLFNRLEIPKETFTIQYINATPKDVFIFDESGQEIKGANDIDGYSTLLIPSGVTKICDSAFSNSISNSMHVVFNDELEEIGNSAFTDCNIVGELNLPSKLKKIGEKAFMYCGGITGKLIIPATVEQLSKQCFEGCHEITQVQFDSTADSFSFPYRAFADCKKLCVLDFTALPREEQVCDLSVGEGVEEDKPESYPFYNICESGQIYYKYYHLNCYGYRDKFRDLLNFKEENDYEGKKEDFDLEWRNMPGSGETEIIDHTKWLLCGYSQNDLQKKGQEGYIYPFDVKEDYVIKNQTNLAGLRKVTLADKDEYDTVMIPNQILSIADHAFQGEFVKNSTKTDNWTMVGPKYWHPVFNIGLQSIGNYAFADNPALFGDLSFPTSLKSIGDYAFNQAIQIRGSLNLPVDLEKIGTCAFSNCIQIYNKNLILPKTMNEVGANAFYNTTIENIILLGQIDKIDSFAFNGVKNLKSIDLSNLGEEVTTGENWSRQAFCLSGSGTILVAGNATAWKSILQTRYGLPNSWDVTNII